MSSSLTTSILSNNSLLFDKTNKQNSLSVAADGEFVLEL